ncbi:MAG TPA: GAF domain-containing protein, partial [Thermoanaerobaculia bacterium]|nr:GAF domain-containing protein [Thermoanaerobaculia bacterium]
MTVPEHRPEGLESGQTPVEMDPRLALRVDAHALIDALTDAVIVADSDNSIVAANPAVESLLGWSAEDLVGQALTAIIPRRLRSRHLDGVARAASTGVSTVLGRPLRMPALRRDGGEVLVDLSVSAFQQGDQRLFVGTLRRSADRIDVTGQSALALRLVQVLAEATTLQETAPKILQALVEGLDWDVAELWVVDWDERQLRFANLWHRPSAPVPVFAEDTREHTFRLGEGLLGRVWSSREPIWIDDLLEDPNFPRKDSAAADGLRRGFGFPIMAAGRLLAVVALYHRQPGSLDPYLIDTVATIGDQLGHFIEHRLAEETVRSSQERLDMALDAGQMGTWDWDMESGLITWSHALRRIFALSPGSAPSTLSDLGDLVHPDDRAAVMEDIIVAGRRHLPYHREFRIVLPDSETRWLETRGRVLRDDAGRLHMVGVATDITERRQAEEERAQLLAREREARAKLEISQRRLAFLAEASGTLAASLDYQKTLAEVTELVVPELADWCFVYGLRDDGAVEPLAVSHRDEGKLRLFHELEERYPFDPDSPAASAAVLRTGESRLFERVDDDVLRLRARDSEHLDLLRKRGFYSAMVVPLIARGRTFGTLTFASDESRRVYTAEDLSFAEDLARRAAAAIDNARLYQERSRVADALQSSLLPPHLPEIPGVEVAALYRPAGEGQVGGDFYDLFPAGDGSWWIMLGDVRGKGPTAAAVTALVRYTVRAAAMSADRPSAVLEMLNQAMLRQGQEESDPRFCTLVLASLRAEEDGVRLSVASGGHPLPMVVRAEGRIGHIGGKGMLVGSFEAADFIDETAVLGPGESLVLFTDGVTDARVGREVFGEQGLGTVLTS